MDGYPDCGRIDGRGWPKVQDGKGFSLRQPGSMRIAYALSRGGAEGFIELHFTFRHILFTLKAFFHLPAPLMRW